MKKVLLVVLLGTTLVGCASFTSPARQHELDSSKNYWLDYDVGRRGSFILADGHKWKSCAEPSPDVALDVLSNIEGKLDTPAQGSLEGKAALSQKSVSLSERTQMVLFLRESMYRLCELSVNMEITPEQASKLYGDVLSSALSLVRIDQAQAEADKANAEAGRVMAERLTSADRAKYIYEELIKNKVDNKVIQEILKNMP